MASRFQSAILIAMLSASASGAQDKERGAAAPAPRFVDITSRVGVQFQHASQHTSRKYLLETMGSGVALFDYDNDGRLDLFFVNGAEIGDPTPPSAIPAKTGPEVLESALPSKTRRNFSRM